MGTVDGPASSDPMVKEWLLKRNCSASPRQVFGLYVSLVVCSCGVACFMLLHGAWPVLPFAGLELAAVGVAFVIYARHAVDYEYIGLSSDRLVIERMSAERLTHIEFNPRWVRVEPGATPRDQITVHSAGTSVTIGQHLALHLREPLARELRMWIRRCS